MQGGKGKWNCKKDMMIVVSQKVRALCIKNVMPVIAGVFRVMAAI
jgi:hypothetical protein